MHCCVRIQLVLVLLFGAAALSSGQQQPQLQQALIQAIQQNPALIQTLRNNPALVHTLTKKLQQQQQQPQVQTPLRTVLPQPTSVFQSNKGLKDVLGDRGSDQCLALRQQNARLKQIVRALTDVNDHNDLTAENLLRSQRELNPAHLLLQQMVSQQQEEKPRVSVQRVLVTPTPTWSTQVETSSYVTVITTEVSTEVPIIVRGNKVYTTIVEPTTQTVTATEVKTSSTLISPSPTWESRTITITPTASASASNPRLAQQQQALLPSLWPKVESGRQVDPLTGLEYADVLEIGKETSPSAAKTRLDRLKQAYGIFFANSAQRSAQRFGDIIPRSNPIFNPRATGTQGNGDLDYDYIDEFDQQGLAAQAWPVSVKQPGVAASEAKPSAVEAPKPSSKVFTLYFSGKKPGEYTTRLTTLAVGSDGQPVRSKREAIAPSKPQPITQTDAPGLVRAAESEDLDDLSELTSSAVSLCSELGLELQSSIQTVTVTQTVTVSTDRLIPVQSSEP